MQMYSIHDLVPHLQGQLRGECGSAVKLKLANEFNYASPLTQHIDLPEGKATIGVQGLDIFGMFPNRNGKQTYLYKKNLKDRKQIGGKKCGK